MTGYTCQQCGRWMLADCKEHICVNGLFGKGESKMTMPELSYAYGNCCSGYPNCIHKPEPSEMEKIKEIIDGFSHESDVFNKQGEKFTTIKLISENSFNDIIEYVLHRERKLLEGLRVCYPKESDFNAVAQSWIDNFNARIDAEIERRK